MAFGRNCEFLKFCGCLEKALKSKFTAQEKVNLTVEETQKKLLQKPLGFAVKKK